MCRYGDKLDLGRETVTHYTFVIQDGLESDLQDCTRKIVAFSIDTEFILIQ